MADKTSKLATRAVTASQKGLTGSETAVLNAIRKAGKDQSGLTVKEIQKALNLPSEKKTREYLRHAQKAAASAGDLVFAWTQPTENGRNRKEYFVIPSEIAKSTQSADDVSAIFDRATDFAYAGKVKGRFVETA